MMVLLRGSIVYKTEPLAEEEAEAHSGMPAHVIQLLDSVASCNQAQLPSFAISMPFVFKYEGLLVGVSIVSLSSIHIGPINLL